MIDFKHILEGSFLYGVTSYAMRTFPQPNNIYAKWVLGVIQYAVSNPDLAAKNFQSQEGQQNVK